MSKLRLAAKEVINAFKEHRPIYEYIKALEAEVLREESVEIVIQQHLEHAQYGNKVVSHLLGA
jgi:hypothetical protein